MQRDLTLNHKWQKKKILGRKILLEPSWYLVDYFNKRAIQLATGSNSIVPLLLYCEFIIIIITSKLASFQNCTWMRFYYKPDTKSQTVSMTSQEQRTKKELIFQHSKSPLRSVSEAIAAVDEHTRLMEWVYIETHNASQERWDPTYRKMW